MSAPSRKFFPNPRTTRTENDILCVGGELESEILREAYGLGIFPWPHEGLPMLWFCPEQRGVLDFSDLHLPRSFQKWLKKNESQIEIKFNQDFEKIISNCARAVRPGQKGTWITTEIQSAYLDLFEQGAAFSLGCYRENTLIGGIYGVRSESYYSCESMFFTETNASKLALYKLIEKLKLDGHQWIDIQMVTDVSGQFGGKYISKKKFLDRIKPPKT
jgi:leucyl/phenylalanyl-tRNA---protein transferase